MRGSDRWDADAVIDCARQLSAVLPLRPTVTSFFSRATFRRAARWENCRCVMAKAMSPALPIPWIGARTLPQRIIVANGRQDGGIGVKAILTGLALFEKPSAQFGGKLLASAALPPLPRTGSCFRSGGTLSWYRYFDDRAQVLRGFQQALHTERSREFCDRQRLRRFRVHRKSPIHRQPSRGRAGLDVIVVQYVLRSVLQFALQRFAMPYSN